MSFLTLISRQKVKVAYIYFHSIISTNIGGCSSIALYSEFCLSINRILLDFHIVNTTGNTTHCGNRNKEIISRKSVCKEIFLWRESFLEISFKKITIFPSSLSLSLLSLFSCFQLSKHHGKFTPENQIELASISDLYFL